MTSPREDEDFREIQLSGKQLVFLFMAATVVSVVLFLCGVLVGRGVRAARETGGVPMALGDASGVAIVANASASMTATPTADGTADPRTVAPPPAIEDLNDTSGLDRVQPAEASSAAGSSLPPTVPKPVPVEAPKVAPVEAVKTAGVEVSKTPPVRAVSPPSAAVAHLPAADSSAVAAPRPGAWAVQVAALNVRSEADAVAKRLASKGYAVYVVSPPDGSTRVFRVRIGPFTTRRDADTVAVKLQKEEQIKPWVTR